MVETCKHGHPFDETNDYRRPDFGWRVCRKCNLNRWHERQRRKAENNFAGGEKTS